MVEIVRHASIVNIVHRCQTVVYIESIQWNPWDCNMRAACGKMQPGSAECP